LREFRYSLGSVNNVMRQRVRRKVFAKEFGFRSKKIELVQAMYEDTDNALLLSIVQNIPASSSQAFLFGHDPSFNDFSRHLIANFEKTMPKGAVVMVGFDCDSWADVGLGGR